MTKETILDYLTTHKKELQQKYQIEKIGIFGSYSRDEEKEHSDIDIFVKMKPSLFDMIALKEQIEKDLQKDVDIIREHKNIKPLLLKMIQKDIIYV
jgi:predicted nucleotidyltransferase